MKFLTLVFGLFLIAVAIWFLCLLTYPIAKRLGILGRKSDAIKDCTDDKPCGYDDWMRM